MWSIQKLWLSLIAAGCLVFLAFLMLSLLTQQPLWLLGPVVICFTAIVAYRPKWLFYALVFFLPLSMEIMITGSLGTDMPDEFLMILLSPVILFMLAHDPRLLNKSFFRGTLIGLLVLHLSWIVVSMMFSENILFSFKYLLAKSWYVIPFVVGPQLFLKGKKHLKILGLMLIIPTVVVAIQSLMRHAFYGFSFDGVKNTLFPFFRNHVVYAAWLVMVFPVIIAAYLLSQSVIMRRWLIAIGCLVLTAIVFSYSRGAWLALPFRRTVGMGCKKAYYPGTAYSFFLIVLVAFGWLANNNRFLDLRPDFNATIFHTDFNAHMLATYRLKDVSTAERFYRWIAAVRMTQARPLTGFGPNTFYENYKPYTVAAYRTWVSRNEDHSTTHNYFLLLLAEQGIPGLGHFFIAVLFYVSQSREDLSSVRG